MQITFFEKLNGERGYLQTNKSPEEYFTCKQFRRQHINENQFEEFQKLTYEEMQDKVGKVLRGEIVYKKD